MIIILKAIHYFLDFDSLDFIPFHLLTSVLHFADRFPSSQLLKVALYAFSNREKHLKQPNQTQHTHTTQHTTHTQTHKQTQSLRRITTYLFFLFQFVRFLSQSPTYSHTERHSGKIFIPLKQLISSSVFSLPVCFYSPISQTPSTNNQHMLHLILWISS
ncbi:hypothetical protein EYC84_006750 [Monilinia fructicola]|uniref:Uncharacterized protein n=1 Tax=Monilinia fructicola TaxID=38448 RepID=A0A5M9K4D1_MONFR|nr:hypothetical protein EYC84_006750 [Monilinia fructicola]